MLVSSLSSKIWGKTKFSVFPNTSDWFFIVEFGFRLGGAFVISNFIVWVIDLKLSLTIKCNSYFFISCFVGFPYNFNVFGLKCNQCKVFISIGLQEDHDNKIRRRLNSLIYAEY